MVVMFGVVAVLLTMAGFLRRRGRARHRRKVLPILGAVRQVNGKPACRKSGLVGSPGAATTRNVLRSLGRLWRRDAPGLRRPTQKPSPGE
jgi:hypothetical protein